SIVSDPGIAIAEDVDQRDGVADLPFGAIGDTQPAVIFILRPGQIKHEWSAGLLCRQVLREGTLDAELREQRVAGENIEQNGAEAVGFALVIIEYGNVRQSFDRL